MGDTAVPSVTARAVDRSPQCPPFFRAVGSVKKWGTLLHHRLPQGRWTGARNVPHFFTRALPVVLVVQIVQGEAVRQDSDRYDCEGEDGRSGLQVSSEGVLRGR